LSETDGTTAQPMSDMSVQVFYIDTINGSLPIPEDDSPYEETAGKHRLRQHAILTGQDVLKRAGRAIGEEVAVAVREILQGVERGSLPPSPSLGMSMTSLNLSFGVSLAVETGSAISAVFAAGGEASVQVEVSLRKTPGEPIN
jgi:hypothetical protein